MTRTGFTVGQDVGATVAGGGVAPGLSVGVDPGVGAAGLAVPGVAAPGLAEPFSEGDALVDPMVGVGVVPPPRAPPQPVSTSALARRNNHTAWLPNPVITPRRRGLSPLPEPRTNALAS